MSSELSSTTVGLRLWLGLRFASKETQRWQGLLSSPQADVGTACLKISMSEASENRAVRGIQFGHLAPDNGGDDLLSESSEHAFMPG